jgi:hypothetical protein
MREPGSETVNIRVTVVLPHQEFRARSRHWNRLSGEGAKHLETRRTSIRGSSTETRRWYPRVPLTPHIGEEERSSNVSSSLQHRPYRRRGRTSFPRPEGRRCVSDQSR